MDFALGGDIAAVAVPGDALHVLSRRRIGQHIERRLRNVPVVIPVPDHGLDACSLETRPEMVTDDARAGR
jgi:hypothetical protein